MTWEAVPLGEVARFVRGVTYKPGDVVAYGEDGVACLRTKNIQSTLDLTDLVRVRSDLKHRVEQRVEEDDVLVSSANSWHLVGRAVQAGADAEGMLIGGFIGGLRFKPADVFPRYGYYWFSSLPIQAKVRSFGRQTTNISNLNVDRTLRLPIPLPPLPEQRRIAAILDEADALRAVRSKSVALLDELPSIRFDSRETSHWRRSTVGDVADLQGGLTVNARRTSLPTVAAYLRVANVFRGSIDLGNLKEIGVSDAELSRTRLQVGDVLVVEGHGNLAEVGRAAMVDHAPKQPLTHQNHLFRLRARGGEVTGRFLELSINSAASRESLKRAANTTSGLNTLNATSIRNLPILVAPLDKQREIEAEFAVIAAARSTARREQEGLDSLFASLQHRAFRGEL